VAFESENVFTRSNVSRQRVADGWSSNSKSATGKFGVCVCVCVRNDQQLSIGRASFYFVNV